MKRLTVQTSEKSGKVFATLQPRRNQKFEAKVPVYGRPSESEFKRTALVETGECDVSGYDLPNERRSDNRAAMSPKDRVRKHRAKLHTQQRRRLEVSISMPLIEKISRIAGDYGVPLWSVVQKALEVSVVDYRELAAKGRLLDEERARLLRRAYSAEWQRQADDYNRKLAVFKERFARFHA